MPNRFEAAVAKAAPVAVREFPLPGVFIGSDKPIVLKVRHAGFTNPELTSASLKMGAAIRKNNAITDERERFIANLQLDAKTYANSVVSWDNALEADGTSIPCTPENVEELLLALVAKYLDLFIRFKHYVNDDDHFVEIKLGDPSELGK